MKHAHWTLSSLSIALVLSACSSAPTRTAALDAAERDYLAAQNTPAVQRHATVELSQASVALEQAKAAAASSEAEKEVDRLAYLAAQKVALTQQAATQRLAEAESAAAGKARDELRLTKRTEEADKAKAGAESATRATVVATAALVQAERQTQEAEPRSAMFEAQLAALEARKTERGMVITFGDVLFGSDLSRLTSSGMQTAQKLADLLQQNPQRAVLVEGFADSTGASAYNQALSERRAGAVQTALQEMGVAAQRVSTRGYGETHPVAANDSAEHRSLNRRVEIVLSDENGVIRPR